MLKVLFFAQLKEQLGQSSVEFSTTESKFSVKRLTEALISQNPTWQGKLDAPHIICAVNQEVVENSHLLSPGDEIAFFPPVTGG